LEVCTIGARYQFSVSVVSWEPGFQIVFLGCSIVKSARNDVNDSVRKVKSLIKLFRQGNHFFMNFPRVFGLAKDKLLDFFKLMDSENTPVVFSMGSSFLSETGGNATVLNWKAGLFDPFASVHGRDGLLRSGDQVSIVAFFSCLIFFASFNFVKVFFKVTQLASFFHDLLFHKVWRLDHIVSSLHEEVNSEVDESVVENDAVAFQEITSVTSDLLASFWVITSDGFQNFMMVVTTSFIGDLDVWNFAPCFNNQVVVFVVVNRDGVMNDVTDFVDFGIELFKNLGFGDLSLCLFFLIFGLNFELLFALVIFVGFLFIFDDVLIIVPFFFEGIKVEPDFSPLLIHLNDEVNGFGIAVSTLKRFFDDIGIVALVSSEPIDVKSWHLDMIFSTIKEMINGWIKIARELNLKMIKGE
jgi:hypothetical protein